jgi:hypothetical protein
VLNFPQAQTGRFEFDKRNQQVIRAYNEPLSVAEWASQIEIFGPVKTTAATQPQRNSVLLRLSAMISQYRFTRRDSVTFVLRRAMTK